jgi:hypothetical protein
MESMLVDLLVGSVSGKLVMTDDLWAQLFSGASLMVVHGSIHSQ